MCGINGIYNYSGSAIPIGAELLDKMNEVVCHRGPDDAGIWVDATRTLAFGHRRLSILDVSPAGHQPMFSPRNTVIVFNGEIYNFKDIREDLEIDRYFSNSDTEVLLYAYEKFGYSMLERLNGMFAFAIWDPREEKLFLARDRIGIKPLYYVEQNGVFIFASEIRSLLAVPWIKAEVDEQALYHFLTYNKVYPPLTMFKGIRKFHPGYMMVVGKGGIERYEKYWEVEYRDVAKLSLEECSDLVRTELKASVTRRMLSDVPVGAFLSGGVDSSAITAYMSELTGIPVSTYSIGMANMPDFTELEWAKKIAQRFGTRHTECIVSADDIKAFLPKLVDIYDEPLADATSIPIHFLSRLARENGTIVILTGDGSDELFMGYRNWLTYIERQPAFAAYSKLPGFVKTGVSSLCNRIGPDSNLSEFLDRAARNQQFFWGGASGFKERTKQNLLSPAFKSRLNGTTSESYVTEYLSLFESLSRNGRRADYIDWLCFYGLKAIVPNFYLHRADRVGMANSIELRVPFLDYNMVNLALSINSQYKVHHSEPKYILKHALEPLLGKEIIYRRKMGFCVPIKEWAGEIMADYLTEHVESFCRETDYFDANFIRQSVASIENGSSKYAFSAWNFYFLINWFKKWIL